MKFLTAVVFIVIFISCIVHADIDFTGDTRGNFDAKNLEWKTLEISTKGPYIEVQAGETKDTQVVVVTWPDKVVDRYPYVKGEQIELNKWMREREKAYKIRKELGGV